MEVIKVSSRNRQELVEITAKLRATLGERGWRQGVLTVYCPHTTAGITINEAADPSVVQDINGTLAKLVPEGANYRHMEGNSDAHIKSSLVGCSEQILVERGDLVLGTWQGVFFAEFDGPRSRKVYVGFSPGNE
ncbi:MAG: secondary thiamine-phosphate synthase enzyme YjbQ [Desulfohalobiaceae bacterium]|nr:secondary thiamine-phosphate synthase enzyme YjbQ [Desulfohalobiaceae bacterium]MCF8085823.1 secondary thiamine-phosphate synthase enzyme YjbQ [Desulfohalobiaceae bacterium]